MIIYGVALLAGCYMAGNLIGDVLGMALGVNANIGGVGFAMLLLIPVLSPHHSSEQKMAGKVALNEGKQ